MKQLLFTIVICFALSSCSCSGGFKHGQSVTVKERCIWASNEETYDQMNKYCSRRDEGGLLVMEKLGQVGILSVGDKGIVTDMDFSKTKIRLDSGKEVWVANKFLR